MLTLSGPRRVWAPWADGGAGSLFRGPLPRPEPYPAAKRGRGSPRPPRLGLSSPAERGSAAPRCGAERSGATCGARPCLRASPGRGRRRAGRARDKAGDLPPPAAPAPAPAPRSGAALRMCAVPLARRDGRSRSVAALCPDVPWRACDSQGTLGKGWMIPHFLFANKNVTFQTVLWLGLLNL